MKNESYLLVEHVLEFQIDLFDIDFKSSRRQGYGGCMLMLCHVGTETIGKHASFISNDESHFVTFYSYFG